MSAPITPSLDAEDFRQLVIAGATCLETHADAINALNVFPVPDGDTGINMLLTLRAANEGTVPDPASATLGSVSAAIAHAALLGARGNSGVIFSQYLRGLAEGLADCRECGGEALAGALSAAADAGYRAVGKPVEGTMLSVMRAAAEAARPVRGAPADVLRAAYDAAERALARTPEQLPMLKQAGVVDAGGQGVVAFLAGALGSVDGTRIELRIAAPAGGLEGAASAVRREFLEHTEEEMYGYCTQFIVEGEGLDMDALRERVTAAAASTVVVGGDRVVRVHAHTEDPGALLSMGAAIGSLDQINIQNMDLQHRQFMASHGYVAAEDRAFAVVAVAPGEGIERLFKDLGAAAVVPGGQTMNPSAADILAAAQRANGVHTVVLPNNKNVRLAAEQAATLSEAEVAVVPAVTVPQGIAAMMAYNPDRSGPENVAAMTEATASVRSGEVTTAVRSTQVNGLAVTEGQAMAMLDGALVAAGGTPTDALVRMLESCSPGDGALVTLYYGGDVPRSDAEAAAAEVVARFEGTEVEVYEGGQPHYQYIVSVE